MILCIETSTINCSAALVDQGVVLVHRSHQAEHYVHAESLHHLIQECLMEQGISSSQLDAVAVSSGPGSYTGLRIGVSAAKGLAYGLGIPLIALDTLSVLGQYGLSLGNFDVAIAMLDARRMEVFTSKTDRYNFGPAEALILDQAYFDQLAQENTIIIGDGAFKCANFLSVKAEVLNIHPSATMMAPLAHEKFLRQEFVDVAYFEPFYLKEFVAGISTKSIL